MSDFQFKLPDIGEGVSEGEIVEWLVKPGDRVREDDPMVEVMTDKATVTIGAPRAGTIKELRHKAGEKANVGDVIVVIDTAGGAATATAAAPKAEPKEERKEAAATAVGDIREGLPGASYFQRRDGEGNGRGRGADTEPPPATGRHGGAAPPRVSATHAGAAGTASAVRPAGATASGAAAGAAGVAAAGAVGARAAARTAVAGAAAAGAATIARDAGVRGGAAPLYYQAKPLATPATRKFARDMSVDLRKVPPTGPNGRVTKDDVLRFAEGTVHGDDTPTLEVRTVRQRPTDETQALEERKPFIGIRRRIAERMQAAKNTAAHFTFVEECDCTRLIEMRDRLRPAAEAAGVKLTFLPFIAKAVVQALKKHPVLNSALDETTNELVYRRYYHLGIAAATEQGLMVPVVRDADRRSILDIAREIDRLGDGARAGTLKGPDLSGSTFTITSLGKQGGLLATPILNLPEVGILGVHRIKERPVVKDGQIVIGHVMLLSLSFDHRIVDGHVGAAFAYDVIAYLENPDLLFLEMA